MEKQFNMILQKRLTNWQECVKLCLIAKAAENFCKAMGLPVNNKTIYQPRLKRILLKLETGVYFIYKDGTIHFINNSWYEEN